MIGKLLDVVWYYEKDSHDGKPYWNDPLFIAAVIAVLADVALRFGWGIDAGLQSRIVDVLVGLLGVLAVGKKSTGVVPKPKSTLMDVPKSEG